MQVPPEQPAATYQQQFHQRWNILNDPHVRALAWLLDAPDLLDPATPQWHGKIASIGPVDYATRAWLIALDQAPQQLHAYLGGQPFTRLGRYSEKLMAFYLEHRKLLFAHGVQVQGGKNETIGEFDFLLRQGDALIHWEFATKLYLLEPSCQNYQADYFVGPNLADTLGAKIRKIMERQLTLSQHPAAQLHLSKPIVLAQALIKGWLFYHGQTPLAQALGISRTHCRGFWCSLAEMDGLSAQHYAVLPRLSWLAPAKISLQESMGKRDLTAKLSTLLATNATPVLIALLEPEGDSLVERARGFIVPDGWRHQAELQIQRRGRRD